MNGIVATLLREISVPAAEGLYHVKRMPDHPSCSIGRDASGNAALLLRAAGQDRAVPIQLAGIEARFAVPCKVSEPDLPEQVETLTAIVCLSRDPSIETYFASVIESLVGVLPPYPTTSQIMEGVRVLVDLFQKLRRPARRPLIGLIGEVCLIGTARDAVAAVTCWRVDPDERYDFVNGNLRLDVKVSANRLRAHGISFEQCNPPPGCRGLIVSTWVEAAGGGTSLRELMRMVEIRLASNPTTISRFRNIVADTLGDALLSSLDWRFDLALVLSSMCVYDAATIPAFRPPLPPGISAVRFISDFGALSPVNVEAFSESLNPYEAALLPNTKDVHGAFQLHQN